MNPRPFPILSTERLILRQLQPSDDEAIFALRSNAEVNTFIQRPLAADIDDARFFIQSINDGIAKKEWLYWAVILQETGQLVGTICLWHFSTDKTTAEIGYEQHPFYQRKGLMAEALQTIIAYSFSSLQLRTIEAYTQPKNLPSIKLLEKNNFVLDLTNENTGSVKELRFLLQNPVS